MSLHLTSGRVDGTVTGVLEGIRRAIVGIVMVWRIRSGGDWLMAGEIAVRLDESGPEFIERRDKIPALRSAIGQGTQRQNEIESH
jgi:hypothetical protein